jgi:hypothetical protein
MTDGRWHPSLTTWVDRVDARWRQLGVPTERRRELRIELVTDLAQARLDGAPLAELVGTDPERFAADVAIAHGLQLSSTPAGSETASRKDPGDVSVPRVAVSGLLGSAVGGVVSLVAMLPFVGWVTHHLGDGSAAQAAAMLTVYVIAALVAAVCGGLAVSSACADSPSAHHLGRRAAKGLVVSGAVATLVTVSFARTTDYSTESSAVLCEMGLVIGICLLGLILVARSARPRSNVTSRAG